MSKGKLLVVDDDEKFLKNIAMYLIGRGYLVRSTKKTTLKQMSQYDIVLLDINLESENGLDILQQRKSTLWPKIIVITGNDELTNRIKAFNYGAFDYVTKPIFPSELDLRIKRIMALKELKPFALSASSTDTKLTKNENRVLDLLLQSKGCPVSIDAHASIGLTKSALYVCLHRLKRKVAGRYRVKNAKGVGYYLVSKNAT